MNEAANRPANASAERLDMECTADNAREFNAALRERLPELHAMAKAFHERGMLPGLRGATLRDNATADERLAQSAHKRAVPVESTESIDRRLKAERAARERG